MMVDNTFTEDKLNDLREHLSAVMSPKRYAHTCAVERMVVRLGELFCPEQIPELRAAALLHDITKEYSVDMQLQKCKEFGIMVSKQDMLTPKTFHAKTAAAIIPVEFPEFCDEEIISAVRWHTTGREGMTLIEKLIYLADYIDETRSFEDCVVLRSMFFDASPEKMNMCERGKHLTNVLIESYDMTIRGLISENSLISDDTFKARNELIINKIDE